MTPNDRLWPHLDKEGRLYANTRGEAFFRDQIAHIRDQILHQSQDDTERTNLLKDYLSWLEDYAEKVRLRLHQLSLADQDQAFDHLFLFMSGAIGIGALGFRQSEADIKAFLQSAQSRTARNGKKKNDDPRQEELKSAVLRAIRLEARRDMAVSEKYADLIRPAVRSHLSDRYKRDDKYPSIATIKAVLSKIRSEGKLDKA